MNNNIISSSKIDEEISLLDLLYILWKHKLLIISLSSIFAIGSVLYALSIPNVYRAEALLAPNLSSSNNIASSMGGLSNLASFAGISLPRTPADKKQEAIAVLNSYQFLESFIIKNNLLVTIMASKSWNEDQNILELDSNIYDVKNSKWVIDKSGKANNSIQLAVMNFREKFGVAEINKTGFVKIYIDSYSPYIAKQWVDWLVADINEHMRSQEVLKAQKSLKFLNEQANRTNVAEIKNVISELIKSDIQTLTLSSSTDEYIFKTIDKAIVPEFKFAPKRAYICIAITLFGGFLSLILAFILEYFRPKKVI